VITSVSTLINGALGALFYFFLARLLGSWGFGVFTVAATSIALLSGIVDLGSDQGIIRFIPKYKNNPETQSRFIKLALKIKILSSTLTAILLILFSKQVSFFLLNQPELVAIVPLIGLGVITQILLSFSTSLSQALERFFLWGGLLVGTNLLRLILLFVLFWQGSLTGVSSLVLYISLPFLGFIASFAFLNRDFLKVKEEFALTRELFNFNKWVFAFVVVAAISSRLDIYFTTRFISLTAVGVYGLAMQIVSILPQLTGAIGAVTSPKFASFTSHELNRSYTIKATTLTTVIAILSAAILIPLSKIVIGFSGIQFEGAFAPFLISLFAMVIFLASSPIRDSIIYYFGKPQFFFWMGLGHAALVTIGSFWLIPRFSIVGSSLVVLIGQVFILTTSVGYWFSQKKNG
jgi:teichuronic acid exporter